MSLGESNSGDTCPLFAAVPSAAMAAARACELAAPAGLSGNRHGETVLAARFARLPAGGELRSVHIHGPRAEIINLFHFPSPGRALPIYAMEFVVFGRRPVVGVIDCKPLCDHPYAEGLWQSTMTAARQNHPRLVYAEDSPDWYRECRSGLDFYTRPESRADLDALLMCHAFVWSELARAEVAAPILDPAARTRHHDAIAAYKDHHRRNTPGLPFLHRSFGPEWTDLFLRKALFA